MPMLVYHSARCWIDRVILMALLLLLVFNPAVSGVVEPATELCYIAAAAVLVVLAGGRWAMEGGTPRPPVGLLVVMGGFIGWSLLQLVPAPASVVQAISPGTIAVREFATSDIGGPEHLPWQPLSI